MFLARDGDSELVRSYLTRGGEFNLQRDDLLVVLASFGSCDLLPAYRTS